MPNCRLPLAVLSLGVPALAFAPSACVGESSEDLVSERSACEASNGLSSINGISAWNGLGTDNGISAWNGLNSVNGLSSTTGLMTTTGGRQTVEYLVRCALPASVTLVKADQRGVKYSFAGQLGLAPAWQSGACDTNCQEIVSACMIALVNTAGSHIPLWIVAENPAVGWALNPDYPNQEGSFFGNIFVKGAHGTDQSKVAAYYCNGVAYNVDTVPGRIGANQVNAPYTDPYVNGPYGADTTGFCAPNCAASDYPYQESGYKACSGWNNVITTYRRAATDGTITQSGPDGLTATILKYLETSKSYCANVNLHNGTAARIKAWTAVYDIGSATQTSVWAANDKAVGSVHTAKSKGPLSEIPAAGTVSFGYCANNAATAATPVIISVVAR